MAEHEVFDDVSFPTRTEKAVAFARREGLLALLPSALTFRATALIYSGRFADASDLLDEAEALAYSTGPSPHPATAAILAAHRGRTGPALEAIEQLTGTCLDLQTARARLLYGEWLRRENRRADARLQLRPAHDAFATMGAEGVAERASRELLATGETVRKRTTGVREDLTAQEGQIARLAAAGRTNPEIGAVLFLSPRTVEWHLRKIFAKLGVTSRRELAATV
jgi:DNA-binding CsgD family transcriptional regulator